MKDSTYTPGVITRTHHPLTPIADCQDAPTSVCCDAVEIAGHCSECREHFEPLTVIQFDDGTTYKICNGIIKDIQCVKVTAVASFALFFVLGMLMSAVFIFGNDLRIPGVN
jgi:hypothetical protein